MKTETNNLHMGHAIRTIRKAAGYSLRETARQVGVSPAYLSGIERGILPSPTHARLRSLADVLGVPAGYLAALSERISPGLTGFLKEVPEAARFIQLAQQSGLTQEDFAAMSSRLRTDGSAGWRKLLAGTVAEEEAKTPAPLRGLLGKEAVWARIKANTKEELIEKLVQRLLRGRSDAAAVEVLDTILRRERESSTGLGGGMAIPHLVVPGLTRSLLGVATLARPIEFNSIDHHPVRVVFILLSTEAEAKGRVSTLARIAQLCTRQGFLEALGEARSSKQLHSIILRADQEDE